MTSHAVIALSEPGKSGYHRELSEQRESLLQGVGTLDLDNMTNVELAQVQEQLLNACAGFDLICGSLLLRDVSRPAQPVRWGAARHSDLLLPAEEFRIRLLGSAEPRPRMVYDFISTEVDTRMRAGWRLSGVLAHPKVLSSLCDEWRGTDMYTTVLAYRDEEALESFFLAEMPLRPVTYLDGDQVRVQLYKEQNLSGGGRPRCEVDIYVVPTESYDGRIWHSLRAEGNSVEETARIMEMH